LNPQTPPSVRHRIRQIFAIVVVRVTDPPPIEVHKCALRAESKTLSRIAVTQVTRALPMLVNHLLYVKGRQQAYCIVWGRKFLTILCNL